MSRRLLTFLGRSADEVAMVDTTGGFAEVVHLDDNHVRKVLLRLRKNGVTVEMALPPRQAIDLHNELLDGVAWTDAAALDEKQKALKEDSC